MKTLVHLDDNLHFIRGLPAEHLIRVDNVLVDFPHAQILELLRGVEGGKVSRLPLHLQQETAGLEKFQLKEMFYTLIGCGLTMFSLIGRDGS